MKRQRRRCRGEFLRQVEEAIAKIGDKPFTVEDVRSLLESPVSREQTSHTLLKLRQRGKLFGTEQGGDLMVYRTSAVVVTHSGIRFDPATQKWEFDRIEDAVEFFDRISKAGVQ